MTQCFYFKGGITNSLLLRHKCITKLSLVKKCVGLRVPTEPPCWTRDEILEGWAELHISHREESFLTEWENQWGFSSQRHRFPFFLRISAKLVTPSRHWHTAAQDPTFHQTPPHPVSYPGALISFMARSSKPSKRQMSWRIVVLGQKQVSYE